MSMEFLTPEDLRTVARNLLAEGQNSRAEVVYRVATQVENMHRDLMKYEAQNERNFVELARLKRIEKAAAMPKRIQRKRTKGWKMPEGAVYVGRPTIWGNPFSVDDETLNTDGTLTAESCVMLFRVYVKGVLEEPSDFDTLREWIMKPLRGKNLACWCPLDQPCHADVLLEIANS